VTPIRTYDFRVNSLIRSEGESPESFPKVPAAPQPDMARALEAFLRAQMELDRDWIRIQREHEVSQARLDLLRRKP
jgi:hypothetical protein